MFHASRRRIAIAAASLLWLGAESPGQSDLFPIDTILASDGAAFDSFGTSVSVSGDVAVIGAPFDDDHGGNSGSAYVFRFNGTTWVQEQKIVASDGAVEDFFGGSVSLSGDVAVVGAPSANDNGSNSGSAHVLDLRALRINADCDDNGIPDAFDVLDSAASDCNDNFIPDSCDIASGFSADVNGNGIPDECETPDPCPSDINGDGMVGVSDLLLLLGAWGSCF